MRLDFLSLAIGMALFPVIAAADDAPQPQPKFPPSFDCSAVAAGSQRQACNRSQLNPPMGSIPTPTTRTQPDTIVPPVNAQPLPTAKPSTIPPLPGTVAPSN